MLSAMAIATEEMVTEEIMRMVRSVETMITSKGAEGEKLGSWQRGRGWSELEDPEVVGESSRLFGLYSVRWTMWTMEAAA